MSKTKEAIINNIPFNLSLTDECEVEPVQHSRKRYLKKSELKRLTQSEYTI